MTTRELYADEQRALSRVKLDYKQRMFEALHKEVDELRAVINLNDFVQEWNEFLLKIRACPECGAVFWRHRRLRRKKFCSTLCNARSRKRAYNLKHKMGEK